MNLKFKEQLELANKYYNNINRISEVKEIKEEIVRKYSSNAAKKDPCITGIMSSIDNFEIYMSKFCPISIPYVLIVKHEVMSKYSRSEGLLYYFTDKQKNEMISPIIMISSRIFEYGSVPLLEYTIMHEVGHYRLMHTDTDRSILDEVEADLYACDSIGIENFIAGMRGLMTYIKETNQEKYVDLKELKSRLKFVASRKGVMV